MNSIALFINVPTKRQIKVPKETIKPEINRKFSPPVSYGHYIYVKLVFVVSMWYSALHSHIIASIVLLVCQIFIC